MAGRKTHITVNGVLHRTGVTFTIRRCETHNAIVSEAYSNQGNTFSKQLLTVRACLNIQDAPQFCHSERSEEFHSGRIEALRFAQGDKFAACGEFSDTLRRARCNLTRAFTTYHPRGNNEHQIWPITIRIRHTRSRNSTGNLAVPAAPNKSSTTRATRSRA